MGPIILVDDETGALEEMAEELQEQGWKVDPFDNPRDALQALTERRYVLGIFDIRMPGMSGVELLERARVLQRDMDVIFITGYPDLSTAIDAVQLGALDYIRRPFASQELVQVVKRTFTYRSLRLENVELASKLGALQTITSGMDATQTLSDILHDTLAHVAATISPNNVYIAFIIQEDLDPILVTHGGDADQAGISRERLSSLTDWLGSVVKDTLRIADISTVPTCPLYLGATRAVVLAPIFHAQAIAGALVCGAPQPDAFSTHDERFLVATAHYVSHVVERAVTADKLRKAEEELFAQKEQERLRYKRMVEYLRAAAGGVAHDLKNPLAIIGGRAQRALKSLDSHSPVCADLQVIQEQALRADEDMNELLDFCYRTDLWVQQIVDLNRLVQETVVAIRHTELPEGVELTAQYAPEPLPVQGDPLQLKRALRNVLDNAIRATQGQGRVTLTTSSDQRSVHIRVHNTGETIPRERREDIFKPYITSKVAVGRSRRSGYGLPVARGILMSHGGNVEVEEAGVDDQGTTFLISVPLVHSEEQA